MRYFSKWLLAALLTATGASAVQAHRLPPPPSPFLPPLSSPIDGTWFFRGDPTRPCFVQTVNGPNGPQLLFTNENGTPAFGWISRDGRRVTIPDWNLTGDIRGNRLVWPNGDFWQR